MNFPFINGVAQASLRELTERPGLILCNEKRDAAFFYDELDGQRRFLVSTDYNRQFPELELLAGAVVLERKDLLDDNDIIVPESQMPKACALINLRLKDN